MSPCAVTPAPLAVVATTPDDSHVWNLLGVQLKLEERGYGVLNLGACTPAELLAETIRDRRPALVVISTVNGHGALSVPKVLDVLFQYQIQHLAPIAVGGLLTTEPDKAQGAARAIEDDSAAQVFIGEDAWHRFDRFLAERGPGGRFLAPVADGGLAPAATV